MNDGIERLRERIEQLQTTGSTLEPDPHTRSVLRDAVWAHADSFLDQALSGPPYRPAAGIEQSAFDLALADEPIAADAALGILRQQVDEPGMNQASAGFLAFIPISSLYVAALADYLASVTNRFAGLSFAGPGAVRVERMLIRWMADFIGYPASAAGDLTSGGSIANLSAIVTAREAHRLQARNFSQAVVYLSQQSHHSIGKALRIAGLQECIKRHIPLDERYRVRAEALEAAIQSDRAAGLHPWLIVGCAGTTDTGAVDPLPALAEIAASYELWLHVDGAYGGMFALCPSGKQVLQGIERADSITIDPHKGLFVPCGTGALLVKDGQNLRQAFSADAAYLRDQEQPVSFDELSPAELSPELTRPFRGLRLWLPLKLAGVAAFRATLEEKLLLARYFYEKIQTINGFSVTSPPDLSIVTFRYVPRHGDADSFNQQLLAAVNGDGRILLSSTTLDGLLFLRLAVLQLRTHLDTIDLALELLREKAAQLEDRVA